MKHLQFTQTINATAQQVWFALWDDFHYRKWTGVFCEGSYVVTDGWKEGSRIHFLGPEGGGMYSTITQVVPNEKMYFTHIGELKNFQEQPIDEKTQVWSGCQENYTLTEADGVTTLQVDMDVSDNHFDYFQAAFPKGLAILKAAAEDLYIILKATINAPLETVWECWTNPAHVTQWNHASDEWHSPSATNDLQVGGSFCYRMEAKDGSFGFDFEGVYYEVSQQARIAYALADGRKVVIDFSSDGSQTLVQEAFHPEYENSLDLQRDGWQMILNNFKKYVESK